MRDYLIVSDSSCDLPADLLKSWGVTCIELTFHEDNSDKEYDCSGMKPSEFYQLMRDGKVFKTAAVNFQRFRDCFVPILERGLDILYVAFSSGLSVTAATGEMAAKELMEEYPGSRVEVVDSLCASSGQGLFLSLAVQNKNNGANLEENVRLLLEKRPKICHWFTVDDLVYLKRGGRVSSTAALVGTVLNIKPVLHVDDEGHLINMSKVRGRKQSIKALVDQYRLTAEEPKGGTYFISHGDCLGDAKYLETLIREEFGHNATVIHDVGPVIGAHSGPGTLALFFVGSKR